MDNMTLLMAHAAGQLKIGTCVKLNPVMLNLFKIAYSYVVITDMAVLNFGEKKQLYCVAKNRQTDGMIHHSLVTYRSIENIVLDQEIIEDIYKTLEYKGENYEIDTNS